MADTILKLKEIEDFFQNLTTLMLGLDPSLPQNQSKVRISWPTAGAPSWKITDDVVFIQVNSGGDDRITRQRDTGYSAIDSNTSNKTVAYTRVHSVKWTLYGPNSFDNAETIKNSLYLSNFKEELAKKNLFLILDITVPMRFPELFNGQWWERTDFTASFNEKVVRSVTVPYLKSASTIIKKG